MIFIYRILINFVFILSPLIIIIRLLKGKEDYKRFKEKFSFFSRKRLKGKVIWFHGASVGELQSIIPLLEKLEKKRNIKQILITSNTVSSSKIIKKYNFKKVDHQFFPIDTNFLINKFLNYWKPSLAIFIDSEIWPNTILNLENKKIPIILLNGRISEKSFKKWLIFESFAKNLFCKFKLCIPSSLNSQRYLKKLGANKIKFIGNLKFSQSENEKVLIDKNLKKFLKKKKVWCASSTHRTEELFCGLVHKKLKKEYKNLLTIIIPRHINRAESIKSELSKLNLKVHSHEPKRKINNNTDIYLVNSYGNTKSFYNNCKNIFLGGSLINHGGQNPLEATRFGCNILHGPHTSNFHEIYKFLKKKHISQQIKNEKSTIKALYKLFKKNNLPIKIQSELSKIGIKILNKTFKEIDFIVNEN